MDLRETASIVLAAPRERVALALAQRDAHLVAEGRYETAEGTFVLQDAPGGTRLVHARTRGGLPLPKPREALRQKVEAELHLVRHLVEDA